jgi:hypothetical protein
MGYFVPTSRTAEVQRRRDSDSGIFLFTIFLAIIAATGFIIGAGSAEKHEKPLVTVTHEGHWWVVADHYFVHHPNCPCTAKPEVEP